MKLLSSLFVWKQLDDETLICAHFTDKLRVLFDFMNSAHNLRLNCRFKLCSAS